MKSINFSISSGMYVNIDDKRYDLHNDYDFVTYEHSEEKKVVTLDWKLGANDWVDQNQPKRILLKIDGVKKFQIDDGRSHASQEDKVALDEISYLTEADWCTGPFITPNPPDPEWDWVFMFQSDLWFIINAESINVEVHPNKKINRKPTA